MVPAMRYSAVQVAQARDAWRDLCTGLGPGVDVDSLLDDVVRYLECGLDAQAVARLLRIRARRAGGRDDYEHRLEVWHAGRCRTDLQRMASVGGLPQETRAALDADIAARMDALAEAGVPLPRLAAAPTPAPAARPAPAAAAATPEARPAVPSGPFASPRDLVAEHSVVILGAVGAFLLVVATVLFELYGPIGLGGGTRLLAIVGLDVVFGAAGFLAIGRDRLRAVGQIYVALAAILLPLVGVAAWSFLQLGEKGITADQALAVTGAACAAVYGLLALRLGLLAYAEMAAIALGAAMWGLAGTLVGAEWQGTLLAVSPLVYGSVQRVAGAREFRHFEWFGHGSALVALGAALSAPSIPRWQPALTIAVLAAAYLGWQAVRPRRLHVWPGEALAIVASVVLTLTWGTGSFRYLVPFALAAALLVLHRRAPWFGAAGRLYGPHAGHVHSAIAAGLVTSVAATSRSFIWPLAVGLWVAGTLYGADLALGRARASGYLVRAALPFALLFTAEAAHLHAWSGAVVAAALVVYALPMLPRVSLPLLTPRPEIFFYGVLPLVAVELRESRVAAGEWSGVAALLVAGLGFALAAERGRVWMAGLSARAAAGGAWFWAVEAAGIGGWRGLADALLAPTYVALAHVRAATRHPAVVQGRRSLIHVAAAAALAITFVGPADELWWRLAAALAVLSVAYWWQAATAPEPEMPWIAWAALAGAALALVQAAMPADWRGPSEVAAAVVLTSAWWPARARLTSRGLALAAFPVLSVLAAIGLVTSLASTPPTWPQVAAAAALAVLLLASWRMRVEFAVIQAALRPAAAVSASAGVLLAAGIVHLDVPLTGVLIVVGAAAHAAWAVRGSAESERWYALAALIASPAALFAWRLANPAPAAVAAEFVILAGLTAWVVARRSLPAVAGVVVIALVPAVHMAVQASGLAARPGPEELAQAALAFAAGAVALALRTRFQATWAWSVEVAAAAVALVVVTVAYSAADVDVAGVALLAYSPIVFAAGVQERRPWYPPAAVAACLAGLFSLLSSHAADTLLYPAGLGVVGLASWSAARLMAPAGPPRDLFVETSRWLGVALLWVAGAAGFAFPDRTGTGSLGAVLAAGAFLLAAGVLALDARHFARPQNLYLGLVTGAVAGFFLSREVGLEPWQLALPGLGLAACGILLRLEPRFDEPQLTRQGLVAVGALLAMAWGIARAVSGDPYWMVVLLIEGVLAVAAAIVVHSRVLLAVGAGAVALVSLRALLAVAQAGYLWVAFGLAALVLLIAAAGLAFAHDRLRGEPLDLREQLGHWD